MRISGCIHVATNVGIKWYNHFEKYEVPQKTKYRTTICSSNPTLGIYPDKTFIQKDACTPMFIATLSIIVETWKQPKCPLRDEWIKKMQCIYTMKYYLAIKENGIQLFAAMRR